MRENHDEGGLENKHILEIEGDEKERAI